MTQHLIEEMERRSRLYKDEGQIAGVNISEFHQYRALTGKAMPRILMIMDEYGVLFSEDDRLGFQAGESLKALVERGRAFGIHVLLSAQRPASSFLSMAGIKNLMQLRIALKSRAEDSILILGEANERAARLTQVGDACITIDPDNRDATVQVRIIRVTPDDRGLYLRGLQAFSAIRQMPRSAPLIVFNSHSLADWIAAPTVAARLAEAKMTALLELRLWLGQPIRIASEVTVDLLPQLGAHCLVLGGNEELAMRLLGAALLGAGLSMAPSARRVLILGTLDSRNTGGKALTAIAGGLPAVASSRQAAVESIAELARELDSRLAAPPEEHHEKVLVCITGLHRWMEARAPGPYTAGPVGEHLTQLLQRGPDVGIHILIWCDRLNSLGNVIGGNTHDAMAYFGHRVALQMGTDESMNFLGIPDAARLGSERAYYRNETWPADVLEKFKPFALPSATEIQSLLVRITSQWDDSITDS